ncbi:MAG: polyphosphate kinase 1 [Thermoanaerobaculia bacterium]|nr:polyphosphate kinase 1 [Thermoanaerobaculia bacterium]
MSREKSSSLKSVEKPPAESASPRPVAPDARFLNRELSWLEFNRRVLAEAEDPSVPLLDRVKFIAIFGSNLDEFFMKRVGGLKQQAASNLLQLAPDGRSPRQQMAEITQVVRPQVTLQRDLFLRHLLPELGRHGVELVRAASDLRAGERRFLDDYFRDKVFPLLTPLAVDPAHPFPFISNLSLSLAVAVRHPEDGDTRFARLKVPDTLPRWVGLPHPFRLIALEDLIALHLDRLFPGMEVVESWPFRVTRNADVQRAEETAEDLLEAIQEELHERRFATVVRLEVLPGMSRWMRDLLVEELGLHGDDVYEVEGPLALRDLTQWLKLPLPSLKESPWVPVTHPRLAGLGDDAGIFGVLAAGDLLVHHPYDSFVTSVQRFIEAAAVDDAVLGIKQSLYRTSTDSRLMKALVRAAEAHKQVAVSVEIKARFDEANNIEWAETLEEAGAHVVYGLVGLKTHAKLTLVVRREADGALRSYAHLATGNYNSETANLYTDLGLFTSRPEITTEVVQVFNVLTGYVHRPEFKKLLVAPFNMKERFLELIEREITHAKAGRRGWIQAKMNALEDTDVVEALYRASQAGVGVDLIVRGICRLRPGVPGLSESIRVISIVGRFLEHPRLFVFGNAGKPEYYLGSADWMVRNLEYRVEVVVPVEEPSLQAELQTILDLQLADNAKAWDMRPDGTWHKRVPAAGEPRRASQEQLMERARNRELHRVG